MRVSAVLAAVAVVLGCGVDRAEATKWTELMPATQRESGRYEMFADARGVWRCLQNQCEHVAWQGGKRSLATLPCKLDVVGISPDGTLVAQRCDGVLRVTALNRSERRGTRPAIPDVRSIAVDNSGVVTMVTPIEHIYDDEGDKEIGQKPAQVLRVALDGAMTTFAPADVPRRTHDRSEAAEVLPARGPWLAYTDGAYALEVAWRATTPPTKVALRGGAMMNGDKMWVSTMDDGYARMTEQGAVKLKHRFGGGLPGHGILLGVAAWGTDGLIAQYETALVLLDGELATKRTIRAPAFAKPWGAVYGAGSSPDGKQLFVATGDGRVMTASL